jgi:hypothetical protein
VARRWLIVQHARSASGRVTIMAIVTIQGLWETHLTVADLDRSIGFYRDVVALTLAPTIEEPEVLPWIPAASVYFRDPDNHSLEFIAMLPEPPRPGMRRTMLSGWRKLHALARSPE